MKTIRDFNPTDIVTINGTTELGVFSVEQLEKLERSSYERGLRDAAEIANKTKCAVFDGLAAREMIEQAILSPLNNQKEDGK